MLMKLGTNPVVNTGLRLVECFNLGSYVFAFLEKCRGRNRGSRSVRLNSNAVAYNIC